MEALVDLRRHLQRETAILVGGVGKLVRMDAPLQRTVAYGQFIGVDVECRRQSEQLEMIFARSGMHAGDVGVSDVEAFAAAATVLDVGVVELETLVQPLTRIIELAAVEIDEALRVDDDFRPVALI